MLARPEHARNCPAGWAYCYSCDTTEQICAAIEQVRLGRALQEPTRKTVGTKELAQALDCDPQTIVKAAKILAIRIDMEFRFDRAAGAIDLMVYAYS